MKNKLVKELLSRSIAFSMVATTALGLGLSGNGSFELLSNTMTAEAATIDSTIKNGDQVAGSALTVNLGANATLKGAISATAIKHSTDGGATQNTEITMDKYYQFGHVVNNPYLNGINNVTVNLTDNAVWNVEGTIKVVGNQPTDDKGTNGDKGNKGHKADNKKK